MKAIALAAVISAASVPGSAATVYNWQGTCNIGCTGIATGVLTLTDDAVGPFNFDEGLNFPTLEFGNPQFISFSNSSTSGNFFVDTTPPGLFAQGTGGAISGGGIIDNHELAPLPVDVEEVVFGWGSQGGAWTITAGEGTCLNADCSESTFDAADAGTGSLFTPPGNDIAETPLPTSWPMFASGLVLMALLAWRRDKEKSCQCLSCT